MNKIDDDQLIKKVDESINLIWKYQPMADKYGGYSVMFSGGKDSQVLLDLFKLSGVNYKAYYNVTTNDPPENVYFIRKNYPEVEFVHKKYTFLELIERKKMLPTINKRFCCSELKENFGKGFVAIGVRKEESAKRAKYDNIVFATRKKFEPEKMRVNRKVLLMPILEWTEYDIWTYIEEQGLKINPLYDKEGRIGCLFCPYKNKKALLEAAQNYPRYFRLFMRSIQRIIDKGYLREFGPVTKEQVWNWWISKQNATMYFNQLELDFKYQI